MDLTTIVLIALAFLFVIYFILSKYGSSHKRITYPYQKVKILTNNEMNFYKQLLPITDSLNLTIFTKVRLADIITIKKGVSKSEWQSAFNRIQSKHFDFVIVQSQTLDVVCVIELDDKSHDREKAVKNDTFKNKTLETVKIPLIRTKTIDGIKIQLQKLPLHL